MLSVFQIAIACLSFTIIPAIWGGQIWNDLPGTFRWTVLASQMLAMLAGFLAGRILFPKRS